MSQNVVVTPIVKNAKKRNGALSELKLYFQIIKVPKTVHRIKMNRSKRENQKRKNVKENEEI